MERAYRSSTRLIGFVTTLVGIALIVSTIARGGGPLTLGVVLGVLLALIGAARLYLASGRHSARAER